MVPIHVIDDPDLGSFICWYIFCWYIFCWYIYCWYIFRHSGLQDRTSKERNAGLAVGHLSGSSVVAGGA